MGALPRIAPAEERPMLRIATRSFVAALIALGAAAALAAAPVRPVFVPGELILKFRDGASLEARQTVLQGNHLRTIKDLLGTHALHVALPSGADPLKAAAALRRLAAVEYAEPNYYRYLDAMPNDPGFPQMYNLDNTGQTGGTPDADIDAPEAWDISVGSHSVVVADLDSGMDMTHVDLVGNLYTNPGEIPGNGIDDDGNGFVDDVHGWDFRDDDNDPSDPSNLCSGHGTHTAGTIGAVGNNGIGVTGVAQQVQIMPLRAFYAQTIFCTAQDTDLIDAMGYEKLMKVPISNNSWGGSPFSAAMEDAIGATRALFVTSAGNSSANNDTTPSYPASYTLENIIAVAATDALDHLASFSNFGTTSVDLAAPGDSIISTLRGNTYGVLSGTSMSSPHVAGAAAVLLADDPTLTPNELRYKLMRGTDRKGLPVYTHGRLNLYNSLTLPPSAVTVSLAPMGSTSVGPGDTIQFQVSATNASAVVQTVTGTVRAWTPGGKTPSIAGPLSLTLQPGQTKTLTLTQTLPAVMPSGDYQVIARVEAGIDIFDEDVAVYTVN
jgi:subtilisin family serine protease